MAESVNDYARAFDQALHSGEEYSTFNRDIQHATVIVCIAIEHAEKSVRLLSHRLDPLLYGGKWFLEAAESFLGRGGKLEILVESDLPDSHPMLQLAKNSAVSARADAGKDHGRMAMKRVHDDMIERYEYNFMVVDEIGYRFETNRRRHEAIVSFGKGSSHVARTLASLMDVFDILWRRSTAI